MELVSALAPPLYPIQDEESDVPPPPQQPLAHHAAASWNMQQVAEWLRCSNLAMFQAPFAQHGVDGMRLLRMTQEELIEIQIPPHHAAPLAVHIEHLRQGMFPVQMGRPEPPPPLPTPMQHVPRTTADDIRMARQRLVWLTAPEAEALKQRLLASYSNSGTFNFDGMFREVNAMLAAGPPGGATGDHVKGARQLLLNWGLMSPQEMPSFQDDLCETFKTCMSPGPKDFNFNGALARVQQVITARLVQRAASRAPPPAQHQPRAEGMPLASGTHTAPTPRPVLTQGGPVIIPDRWHAYSKQQRLQWCCDNIVLPENFGDMASEEQLSWCATYIPDWKNWGGGERDAYMRQQNALRRERNRAHRTWYNPNNSKETIHKHIQSHKRHWCYRFVLWTLEVADIITDIVLAASLLRNDLLDTTGNVPCYTGQGTAMGVALLVSSFLGTVMMMSHEVIIWREIAKGVYDPNDWQDRIRYAGRAFRHMALIFMLEDFPSLVIQFVIATNAAFTKASVFSLIFTIISLVKSMAVEFRLCMKRSNKVGKHTGHGNSGHIVFMCFFLWVLQFAVLITCVVILVTQHKEPVPDGNYLPCR